MVDDNSEHKETKGMNRNVVATISHNEYKNILLNDKCVRHSMNRIQDHRIGTFEITKFLCLALMTKLISKTIDMMDKLLVIRVDYQKAVILITIYKSFFVKLE